MPSAIMAVTRSAVLASYGSSALQSCSTMGVSPEGDQSLSSAGRRLSHSMSLSSSSSPRSRPSTTRERALSTPLRSSRGSGSHRPFSQAAARALERGTPWRSWLKMKEAEPEKRPDTVLNVAGLGHVLERGEEGQARAGRGRLVEPLGLARERLLLGLVVQLAGARARLLVGGDDVDALGQPLGVAVGHLLRGGAVDDDAVAVVVVLEELGQLLAVG